MDVKPTRSELMAVKKRIKLAKSGHSLLKKKRDGLILEFFDIMKEAKTLRQDLVDEYKEALRKANIARTVESDMKLKSIALAIPEREDIKFSQHNIMGVRVPKIQAESVRKKLLERGYSITGSSSVIDEAVDAYEKVVDLAVKAAEVETTMKRLLEEIDKTKRRVNALEFKVMPELKEVQDFIKLRLDEMERESIFRIKMFKE